MYFYTFLNFSFKELCIAFYFAPSELSTTFLTWFQNSLALISSIDVGDSTWVYNIHWSDIAVNTRFFIFINLLLVVRIDPYQVSIKWFLIINDAKFSLFHFCLNCNLCPISWGCFSLSAIYFFKFFCWH